MKSKACIMTFRPFNIPAVYSDDMLARLSDEFDMLPYICSKDDFPALEGELQKVEYIFSTWGMPALSEEEIRRYLPRLKAVFYAAGTVQQFARPFIACEVDVFSAWAANAVPVAEVAASEILLANKGFFRREVKSRADWQNDDRERLYPGNFRTRVGILGAGMIGKMVINHLRRHELEIYVFDPFLPDEKAAELGVTKTGLHEVFASCNVISNHLANNEQTKGMIDRSCFDLMGKAAVFINTGRGAQVNTADLIAAMKACPERLALLDVTDPDEPPAEESELYRLPNVRLTPHIAGSIGNEPRRMAEYMFAEYKAYSEGKPTKYKVTAKMLETMA